MSRRLTHDPKVLGLMVLALAGCGGIPDSIPEEPGDFADEDDLRRLWLPASPDNVVSMFILSQNFQTYAEGGCPDIQEDDDRTDYIGNDCTDGAGRTWLGQAIRREDGDETHVDFVDFGVNLGDLQWTVAGRMTHVGVEGGNAEITQALALDYHDNDDSFEAWQDVGYYLDWNDGDYRLNEMSGEVGFEGWGLADVAIDEAVYLGRALTCEYPSGGQLIASGVNQVAIDFGDHTTGECGTCPAWNLDGDEQAPFCGPLHELTTEDDEPITDTTEESE